MPCFESAMRRIRFICGASRRVALRTPPATGMRISGKVPRFGGIALIRAKLFRAFVLSAALAGALTPLQCLAEDANPLPEKATRELPPALLSLLHQKKMLKNSPIILRVFKEEAE